MDNANSQFSRLKLRPLSDRRNIFELKTARGAHLGHIIDGLHSGPHLAIFGSHNEVARIFRLFLLIPKLKITSGRVLFLGAENDENAQSVIEAVQQSNLIYPPKATLWLNSKTDRDGSYDLRAILEFLENHGAIQRKNLFADCAAI